MFRNSLLILCLPVLAQVELIAPDSVPAGSAFDVSWRNGQSERDFLTIVAKGTPEGKYKKYGYAKGKTWQALAPETPGDYEIRYLAEKSPYPTLASKPLLITPITAELNVPTQIAAGSGLIVRWTGPDNPRDFITIVPEGSPERKYKKYKYTSAGNPLELPVPDQPGIYEIRYLLGQSYATLASAKVTVTSVSASLSHPPTVKAGGKFSVSWEGPDNDRDYVTIVAADLEDGKYGKYAYTSKGSPLELPAPDQPGAYSIRYMTGGQGVVLAKSPISVTSVTASLKFDSPKGAGAQLEVHWDGPDNERDYITIVEKGTPERKYGKYRYTGRGNPAVIPVPDVAGEYEVRYQTGHENRTLAAEPLMVEPESATLEGPATVKTSERFNINWTGPDNKGDFVAIALVDSKPNSWPSYSYTYRGNPLEMVAPREAGNYELRYQTGQKNIVLASRRLRVDKADVEPGLLRVVFSDSADNLLVGNGIEVILDASGSMLQKMEGKRRIDIAKDVLIKLVQSQIPAGTPFALRVFGHKEADSCRTDLEFPLSPLEPAKIQAKIKAIQAMNLAKTPIADSLALVAADLSSVKGQRIIILITDGEETCGGDPAAAIEELKKQGMDVRVNIVGFGINEEELKQSFRFWAELGNGSYFDAKDGSQLGESVAEAIRVPYRVISTGGEVVGQGLVNGAAIELPVGEYQIETIESPPRRAVAQIESESEERVAIK